MLTEFKQLVEQHRHRVYSYVFYSLRSAADAEDVTQEVFIKMWKHWQSVQQEKRKAWMMRVAHNAVIDHVRSRKGDDKNLHRGADVELLASDDGAEHHEVVEDGIARAASVGRAAQDNEPGALLDKQQFKTVLQKAITELQEPYRSILIMRELQGHSYDDIGQALELSNSQVKVYLHRGRKSLRDNKELRGLLVQEDNRKDNSVAVTPAESSAPHSTVNQFRRVNKHVSK